MFTLYQRIHGKSHYWTTCGWSDRVKNARHYLTHAEAKCVHRRMTADGLGVKIAVM